MKIRLLISSILLPAILIIFMNSICLSANWLYVDTTAYGSHYIDADSINYDKKYNIVKIWTKTLYTQHGLLMYLNHVYQGGQIPKLDLDISYSIVLLQYDLKNKSSLIVSGHNYNKQAVSLSTMETTDVGPIIPGSITEIELKKALEIKGIKR